MVGSYLTHQFLIAMPTMGDPNFDHTVTYICEHNDDGALGKSDFNNFPTGGEAGRPSLDRESNSTSGFCG